MNILIPLYEGFNLLDMSGPAEMFHWAGYTVTLVAETPGGVTSINGITLQVENGLPTAAMPCDALWVPGGDPARLQKIVDDPHRRFLDFLERQAKASTWVCSVCEGALLLASAGLLDGYTVTTHWAFIPWLLKNRPADRGGVIVADGHPRYVVDRNRLTGGGISSGLDEALKLVEILSGTEKARGVQQTTQYYPDPPVTSRIPNVITTSMA